VALATSLRERLAAIPGVTVRDIGRVKSGIVTFTVDGKDPEHVKRDLAARRMNATVTTLETTRLDMEARGLERLVRSSIHYYNSDDEIARFAAAVALIAR
jgi:cysteine desulfurase/selenocysteine lyase